MTNRDEFPGVDAGTGFFHLFEKVFQSYGYS